MYPIRTCSKIRFNNLENNYFDFLPCIDPRNALSPLYHQNNVNCIVDIVNYFHIFIEQQNDRSIIIDTWNDLIFIDDLDDDLRNPNIEISDFYFGIYNYVNPAGEFVYIKYFNDTSQQR